jgi:3-oxoacyl-[acyl-carrier-protein] synthase II
VGLADTAYNLNFVKNHIQNFPQAALCFSFGFGGQNGVIAVAKA